MGQCRVRSFRLVSNGNNQADLTHCPAHGLPKAAATIAMENGAAEMPLMMFFGWTDPKHAAHHTRKARQKRSPAMPWASSRSTVSEDQEAQITK